MQCALTGHPAHPQEFWPTYFRLYMSAGAEGQGAEREVRLRGGLL